MSATVGAPRLILQWIRDHRDRFLRSASWLQRVNPMQQATGVLWTSWQIERKAGLDMEPTMARTWTLARRGFEGDGYDDGSYEFSFDDLARDAGEPVLAAQLALVHALMGYASTPSDDYERRQLRQALAEAEAFELDIEGLRALCMPVIAGFLDGELPVRAAAVLRLSATERAGLGPDPPACGGAPDLHSRAIDRALHGRNMSALRLARGSDLGG